jgi:hypothetical protein
LLDACNEALGTESWRYSHLLFPGQDALNVEDFSNVSANNAVAVFRTNDLHLPGQIFIKKYLLLKYHKHKNIVACSEANTQLASHWPATYYQHIFLAIFTKKYGIHTKHKMRLQRPLKRRWSWGSSVSIVSNYRLDYSSIPGSGKGFFL